MSTQKVYAEPQRGHVSLGRALRAVLFLVPVVIVSILLYLIVGREASEATIAAAVIIGVVLAILWGIAVSGVRVAAQWERGVVLRLGKFMTVRSPGLLYIVPFIGNIRFVGATHGLAVLH